MFSFELYLLLLGEGCGVGLAAGDLAAGLVLLGSVAVARVVLRGGGGFNLLRLITTTLRPPPPLLLLLLHSTPSLLPLPLIPTLISRRLTPLIQRQLLVVC